MIKSPEVIYLIDTGDGIVWCDDPDPTGYGECGDTVKYVRWDAYETVQAECDILRAALRNICNIYVIDDYYNGKLREEMLDKAVDWAINEVMEKENKA